MIVFVAGTQTTIANSVSNSTSDPSVSKSSGAVSMEDGSATPTATPVLPDKSTRKSTNKTTDKGKSTTKIIIASSAVAGVIVFVLVIIGFFKIKKIATQNTKRCPVIKPR